MSQGKNTFTFSSLLKLPKPVHDFLWRLGYEIRPVTTNPWHLHQLQRFGFHPQTVVDVGVGFGTLVLYKAFPCAYHVLIEPVVEFDPHIKNILQTYRGHSVRTAVGAEEGKRVLHLDPGWPERGSMYTRTALEASGHELVHREVSMTTLDALIMQQALQPPFGLKIDAEGCEYEIIQGAEQFLKQTEFVIAEVAVANRFHRGYTFRDFIDLMYQHKFSLCEILDVGRNDDHTLTFIDAVFRRMVPLSSPASRPGLTED